MTTLQFQPVRTGLSLAVVAVLSGLPGVAAQTTPKAPRPASRTAAPAADPAGTQTVETKHLTISTSATAAAGGRATLFVDITPRPKMHVYSPEQKDYIPVAVKVTADDAAFKALPVRYPAAETYFFKPLNETHKVYTKPFRVQQPITLTGKAAAPLTIKGSVRYQACDDAICYMPQEVPVSWTVAVKR